MTLRNIELVTLCVAIAGMLFGVGACSSSRIEVSEVDRRTLEGLVDAGADLSKPHEVEFFLYFPSKLEASKGCTVLASDGFTTSVREGATGPDWLCFAVKETPLDGTQIAHLARRMEAVAAASNGEYDGWGASVVE